MANATAAQQENAKGRREFTPQQLKSLPISELAEHSLSGPDMDKLGSDERREQYRVERAAFRKVQAADRFRRVAKRRTEGCIKALRGLAQCGNRNVYEYTDEQRDKVLTLIRAELEKVEHAFTDQPREREGIEVTL